MSEETKEILEELKNDINIKENWQYVNDYYVEDMRNLLDYIEDLQQKVEQLEKENKELKYDCSCSFHDAEELNQKLTEIIDERNELDTKLIQLENIRKEAIEYIEGWQSFPHTNCTTHNELKNLLNILNKGSDKQ